MSVNNDPIPVTILSGSLGAGKTTTLNHLLGSERDLNAAVLVNDMGEVNIDAEFVERESALTQNDEEIIELSNGCICCRLRGDMLDEVGRLAAERDFDYLLVESSGISEPIPVAQTFARGFEDAEFDPTGVYELDTMVSVVDAHSFWQGFDSGQALTDDTVDPEDNRVPEEALMDQIEFCDVLLLNKCDLVPQDELEKIEAVLKTLQPWAKLIRTEHGAVAPEEILNTGRFDFNRASQSAGWKRELQEGHHHDAAAAEEHGVTSFVFDADRPFHPDRVAELFADLPDGVVRAKGFFWSAGREDIAMGLDKAGQSVRAGPKGTWIATLPKAQQQRYFAARPGIKADWDDKWGDRGVQLVFIGREFDQESLVERLNDCLLTDAEMDEDWGTYPDPFGSDEQRELALADD
ncbi:MULTISPECIES: GTP-binding protein [unclassified Haloferax]|uniref:GTP-binding protein n=1 Tax=unclassified Haloferax TaxID=2625095 RepID=UPI0002B0E015|nr:MULTISPECIES: GTP-binding protein [unclassified Haloferax]ELZ59592.1 cobW domain-containing protein [Haloferax sp. ATCC BAA-646]ELZ60481.1 cobW domain-containing protein [Haloferax sp. ATCC BAA-645]ELZ72208.1 cobW domain-containing protein [Haloferax sp. ATCC BAA-644]